MPALVELDRVIYLEVKTVWPDEARDFTPWLAEPANLSLLATSLGFGDLQLTGQPEVPVGEFYCDLLLRDPAGQHVVVENQFGNSDHDHLGKSLTYLAGVSDATTVVWISEKLRDSHRAAIEWLNANTPERFAFLGVELKVVRIDGSKPAPLFMLVAQPNGWARRTRRRADVSLSEENRWWQTYWSAFAAYLQHQGAREWLVDLPLSRWWGCSTGRTGFRLYAIPDRNRRQIAVTLEISEMAPNSAYEALVSERAKIDAEFGRPLDWSQTEQRFRISTTRSDLDPNQISQWPEQHRWMLEQLRRFREVFADRIQSLDVDAVEPCPSPQHP